MLVKQGVEDETIKNYSWVICLKYLMKQISDYIKEDEKFLDDEGVTKIDDINVRNEKLLGKIDEDIVNLRGLVGQSMDRFKRDLMV